MSAAFIPGIEAPGPIPDDAYAFVTRGLEVLLRADESSVDPVPRFSEVRELMDGQHFLGTWSSVPCVCGPPKEAVPPPPGFELVPARALFGRVDPALFAAAGRAIAISEWDRGHRFCGKCGARTELVKGERVRRCTACRTPYYPRISPAVIVLVHHPSDGSVLLAQGKDFRGPWYSTLAGFVEPGESLEEAVAREVKEEVGIELEDIRYFGSQPWPFGRSLMVGFNARYAGGELKLDPNEIADAQWFTRERMPPVPPRLSIARMLIDAWLGRQQP